MKVEVPVHKFLLKTLFAITLLLSGQAGWAEDYRLVSSPDSNRVGQTPLEGATVSGDLYGRMLPETGGIIRVFYYLDGSGSQFKSEFKAPYDLNGGPSSGARPYDTTALSDGAHTIRAEVLLSTGELINFDTNITVANQGPPQNTAPVLNSIGNQSIQANNSKTVSISANDVDNDTLTITASGVPNFASFTDNGNGTASLVLNPTTANVGSSNITVTVSDGALADSETIQITVTAISNSPYSLVSSPGSNRVGQTPLEGAIVSGDLYGRMLPETGGITRVYYYLDGATTEFKRESQAPYDLNGGPASGARPYDTTALSDGAHTIRAEVLLNTGQFINFDTHITVANQGPPQNSAPALNTIGNQSVQAGNSQTVAISASDVDNDTLTITASGAPGFANFIDNGNGTASLILNPTVTNVGSFNVTVTVTDGALSDSETFTINHRKTVRQF